MALLGVNIDHVATIRQARQTVEPDPVWAATLAELGGADSITVHLREDRRHIQDRDLEVLRRTVQGKLNLEAAIAPAMVDIACRVRPDQVTLVPERREEITTEGGLDVTGHRAATATAVGRLHDAGIAVSLFIDPDPRQIEAAVALHVAAGELYTGEYANATPMAARHDELVRLASAATLVREARLVLNAGHGLTYRNVVPVAELDGMHELNIGHSIVSRAVLVGFTQAVREMKQLVQ
ncbi:MAG: pyridoxine 5'-phosphate synthase [Planctomycetota bacterium]|nr:pyridoxine 5'-phosphate synthase [Planctomycetota bacterium]